jgi:dUTP pyrophosphatase
MKMNIQLDDGAIMPVRAHDTDAGIDLFTPVDFVVPAHGYAFVDTGVHVEIPRGTDGHVRSKSGLNRKSGITADGTIDEGYTGTIGVTLHNSGDNDYYFVRGNKVAQLVIEKIFTPKLVVVRQVSGGDRGDDGYGSTGE